MPRLGEYWEHHDSIHNIRQIEEKDVAFLVANGVARLRPSTQNGSSCTSLWQLDEPSKRYSRVYEIYLSGGAGPELIRDKVVLRFWYYDRTNRGCMMLKDEHFNRLFEAFFPHKKFGKVTMRFGEVEPWRIKA